MQAKTTLQLGKPGFSGKGHVLCFRLRREKTARGVLLREGKIQDGRVLMTGNTEIRF